MSRASAPAITSPDSATDTTLGTMPERRRGPVSSITATRLLVVPKSIPTMGDFSVPKSIWKDIFHFFDQIFDISAAIKQGPHLVQVGRRGERLVDRISHGDEPVFCLHQLR